MKPDIYIIEARDICSIVHLMGSTIPPAPRGYGGHRSLR